jgi:hypothetical protein
MSRERLEELERLQRKAEAAFAKSSARAETLKADLQETLAELKGKGVNSVAEAEERIASLRARSDEFIEKAFQALKKGEE